MTVAPARHRRQPVRSDGPHFEAFCRRYCRHTVGPLFGKPLEFEPFQRRLWKEALRFDRRGRRVYQTVFQGRPRKNAKTTESAALGLWLVSGAAGEPGPHVAIGSGSREQAGLVFNQARDFVFASPELQKVFKPQASVILAPSLFGILKRVSSEGRLQMGMNLSGGVVDEVHVLVSESDRMLWAALTTSSGTRTDPFLNAITTAGWDKQTICGELYDAGMALPNIDVVGRYGELTIGRDEEAGFLFWWYGMPDGADLEDRRMWRAVNPLAAVSMDYLERQWKSPTLSTAEFIRYHANGWTAAYAQWIPESVWRQGETDDEIPEGAEVYGAVDAALTRDTTALTLSHRRPDGRVITEALVWSARMEAPHDVFVPGGRIDNSLVTEHILGTVIERYQLRELVYDPRYFEDQAQLLGRSGVRVAPVEQWSRVMSDAVARYYVDVHEGTALHLAGEPGRVFSAHVAGAAATKTDNGWKVSKLKQSRPIDALTAAMMSHSRAARKTTSVYERRGLIVLDPIGDAREAARARMRARAQGDDIA